MTTTPHQLKFIDDHEKPVKYDGSPLSWRVSAYALIVEADSILLVKHNHEPFLDLPGGGIELGESISEGLKREALEEAGAQIKIGSIVDINSDFFYHKYDQKYYQTVQLFFAATRIGQLKTPTEKKILEVKMTPISQLKAGQIYSAALRAIKKITK